MIEVGDDKAGDSGGYCQCRDGQSYLVGDNFDNCGSLACVGGYSSGCQKTAGAWSRRKVTCGEVVSGSNQTFYSDEVGTWTENPVWKYMNVRWISCGSKDIQWMVDVDSNVWGTTVIF